MISVIINLIFICGVIYFIQENSEHIEKLEKTVERQEVLINRLRSER